MKTAVARIVVAQYFGWRASTVCTIKTASVKVGPIEGSFRALEFKTSVFKRKEQYPIGRMMVEKLPAWMRVVVKYVMGAKEKGVE